MPGVLNRRGKASAKTNDFKKGIIRQTGPDSKYQESVDNNNTVFLKEDDSDENSDEEVEICKHMKNIDMSKFYKRKKTDINCNTCDKTAQFSCIHEICIDEKPFSCCSEIVHIFDHIARNDHPVIVHHEYDVVLCTQCNVQVSSRRLLKHFGLPTVAEMEKNVIEPPVMLQAVMGYVNFGNTCYMNAVFQLLGHCSPFSEYFTTLVPPDELNNSQTAAKSTAIQLALDFRMMWSSLPIPFISPWRIIQCIRAEMPSFESFQQQDATEFLRALLDILDRELKLFADFEEFGSQLEPESLEEFEAEKEKQNRKTIVSDTFQGALDNQIQCHSCGFQSRTFENFLDISVPILSEAEEYEHFMHSDCVENSDKNASNLKQYPLEGEEGSDPGFLVHRRLKNKTNLIECMDRFFQNSTLQGDNQYSCSKCNKLVDATKSTRIVSLPEVIVIQLKRFRHTMFGTRKVDKVVEFPVRSLDFARWTSSEEHSIYDLAGFVVHEGHNVEFGHYVTYCRHEHDKMWYKFDDLNITRCDVSKVAEQQPYILMFKRRHFEKSNPARIRRPTESQYNCGIADKRYKENCPNAWSLVQEALEPEKDRATVLEKFLKENSSLVNSFEARQIMKEFESEDPQTVFETLNKMMIEIKQSIKQNKKNKKGRNGMSKSNVEEAIDKLVVSMDEWLKKIMKKQWVERELMHLEKRARFGFLDVSKTTANCDDEENRKN